MAEKCPLRAGDQLIGDIPEFCLIHCYQEWDTAITEQNGYVDFFDPSKDDCNHNQHDVENSHEGLQKPDDSSRRNYSFVDLCGGCEQELMETSYIFECPFNDQ